MSQLDKFLSASRISDSHHLDQTASAYPVSLENSFPRKLLADAQREIRSWEAYSPTPLLELTNLSKALGLATIYYKDESRRFGLGSFKALGGAYAVLSIVKTGLANGFKTSQITVATATDGNHGRSVAWGAKRAGCACKIFIHSAVSQGREDAMAVLGAEVIRINGDYDESVRQCAQQAATHKWEVISDTSWAGYTHTPSLVMAGYTVMVSEVLAQLDTPPTHIFIQAGVGGLAAAVAAAFWQALAEKLPKIYIVESEMAACLIESARIGQPATVDIQEETLMAGLSCGETSPIAWEILSRSATSFLTISDDAIVLCMQYLASGEAGAEIEAGESAVTGIIAIAGAMKDASLSQEMGLDEFSRVLVFGTEGATDPEIYRQLLAS